MKRLFPAALLFLVGALTCSCSDDNAAEQKDKAYLKKSALQTNLSLGEMHNMLLTDYFSSSHNPEATTAEIDMEINTLMATYGLYTPSCGTTPCYDLAEHIVTDPMGAYTNYLPQSGLSSEAITGFTTLLQSFSAANGSNLQLLVEQYKLLVLSNPNLSQHDKQVLLNTCEIAAASLKFGKERKDKDWETSVGNIIAAFRGAGTSTVQSIRLSLVTGIAAHHHNRNI